MLTGGDLLGFFTRSEQVIIVDDDHVRSVTIGPRQRLRPALYVGLALLGMVAALGGWIGVSVSLDHSRKDIANVEQGADSLARQLAESRDQLSRMAEELDNARNALNTALAEEQEARTRIDAAFNALAEAEQPGGKPLRQVLLAARAELAPLRIKGEEGGSHLSAAEQSLAAITEASQEFATRRAQAAAAALELSIGGLSQEEGNLPTLLLASSGLSRALAEAQADALRRYGEAEAAKAERDAMGVRLAAAEQRMSAVAAGQVALLARLNGHAQLRVGMLESELKGTGINLDKVLSAMADQPAASGGPLVGLPALPEAALPPEAVAALQQLESSLDRQAKLRSLGNYLPLTPPVDNFYTSSGFGSRRDPFTNEWATHTGLDLVAREGSPVTLPAAGKVVAITFDDGYGRMVEVDHGFAVHTRYAHLGKVLVKQGDILDPGSQIGTLGNSGRSSGPHLHYEVLLEGKPVDPLRFMEKSRHVCEG